MKTINRDRIYVAIENPNSGFACEPNVVKIGVSDTNSGGNKDPKNFHQRERALTQGNVRGIKIIHSRNMGAKSRKIEKSVFIKLRHNGEKNIHDESQLTGHSEWWNMDPNEAIRVLDEVIEKEYFITEDLIFDDDDDKFKGDPDDWDLG